MAGTRRPGVRHRVQDQVREVDGVPLQRTAGEISQQISALMSTLMSMQSAVDPRQTDPMQASQNAVQCANQTSAVLKLIQQSVRAALGQE